MFNLNGKIAVVTGGGSGIGKAISIILANQGASVHIVELNSSHDFSYEKALTGGLITRHICNVTDQEKIYELFQRIGRIDILVNNAGIAHIGKADNTTEADFDQIYNVNVKGAYNCLYSAIPLMKNNGGGVVLNMASIAVTVGLPDRFAYSMSKGAIYAITLSVDRDYPGDKILCNSISPARVHTPFVDGFISKDYPGKEAEMFEKLSKSQSIGHMAIPEEVALMALYLCSDEASFVTGCDYHVDGGFTKLNGSAKKKCCCELRNNVQ